MLRVIVESASNIPKTKFGKPDPIVSVIFKGKEKFSSFSPVLFWNVFRSHVLSKSAFRRLVKPNFSSFRWSLLPVQVRGKVRFLWKAFNFPQGFETCYFNSNKVVSVSPWREKCVC